MLLSQRCFAGTLLPHWVSVLPFELIDMTASNSRLTPSGNAGWYSCRLFHSQGIACHHQYMVSHAQEFRLMSTDWDGGLDRKFTHDPRIYANPHLFNPDRFISSEGKKSEPDPRNFCFGFGRRFVSVVHINGSSIIWHWNFRTCPGAFQNCLLRSRWHWCLLY